MYLSRTEENLRSVLHLIGNLLSFVMIGSVISLIMYLFLVLGLGIEINMIKMIIVLTSIVTIIMTLTTISKTIVEVDGNQVLLTVNPLCPRKISNGQNDGMTDYTEYTTGLNILLWWENIFETVPTVKDVVIPISGLVVSAHDDEPSINGTVGIVRDPRQISLSVLQGKDEKERWENITAQVKSLVESGLESGFSGYAIGDIIGNSRQDIINIVIQEFYDSSEEFMDKLGVKFSGINISDINPSEDVANSRKAGKELSLINAEIKRLVDEEGWTRKEAASHVRIVANKSKGEDIMIRGDSDRILKQI